MSNVPKEVNTNIIIGSNFNLREYSPIITALAQNPNSLKVFGEDELLAKRILYYLQYTAHQLQINNMVVLDMTHFAETLRIPKNHLQERVPDPHQFDKLSDEEVAMLRLQNRTYETRFLNTLYKLAHMTFNGITTYGSRQEDDDTVFTATDRFIPIISAIEISIYKKNRNKQVVSVQLSNEFLVHHANRFTLVHHETYVGLLKNKRPNIEDLYAFLELHRKSLQSLDLNLGPVAFDKLCTIARLENIQQQFKKKQKLISYLDYLSKQAPHLGLGLHWEQKGKHKYLPIISYNNPAQQLTRKDSNQLRLNIFQALTEYFFKQSFINLNSDHSDKLDLLLSDYQTWFKDPTKDRKLKYNAYASAWSIAFNKDFVPERHDKYAYYFIDNGTHYKEVSLIADTVREITPSPVEQP